MKLLMNDLIKQLLIYNVNGEKVLISTFIGGNRSSDILDWHKKVFNNYKIPNNYIYAPFEAGISYGGLINYYVSLTLDHVDYYVFLDTDALFLKKDGIDKVIEKIKDKETIWGIAQQSTHILKNGTPIHPYAGFTTCAFSKELYIKIGKPSFDVSFRGDIAEELTWRVKEMGFNICLSYPVEFHELTDEEVKNTGNTRHGWVDNGIKVGLGTTFGAGLCYHSFHQAVIPGTNTLAIPRSAEIFIQKAKLAIENHNKNRKLEMITSCVNGQFKYSDFLRITLPLNKKHFDNILVVTTLKDIETQSVCRENNVDFYCTDEFFANGSKFDCNRAMNAALHKLKYKDWIVSASPDIIYQDDFREKLKIEELDSDTMYGTSRLFVDTYKDWRDYLTGKRELSSFEEIPGWGCGFTQIFDLNSSKLKGIPLNQTFPSNGQAVESDIWMLRRFHPDVRDVGKLPITVIHLGHKDFGGKIRDESGMDIPFFFNN